MAVLDRRDRGGDRPRAAEAGREHLVGLGAARRQRMDRDRRALQHSGKLHAAYRHGLPHEHRPGLTIGHNVVLHGCTIAADCLIGMGAVVLNGAKIGALAGRRRRAGHRGQGVSRQFADRRLAGACDQDARGQGRAVGCSFAAAWYVKRLEPVRQGLEEDRLAFFTASLPRLLRDDAGFRRDPTRNRPEMLGAAIDFVLCADLYRLRNRRRHQRPRTIRQRR